MNLEYKSKYREESKHLKRRYTMLDMAIVKRDAANRNGQIKRGEVLYAPHTDIILCGCGMEGCFLHINKLYEKAVK